MANTRQRVELKNRSESELHKMSATLDLHRQLSDMTHKAEVFLTEHKLGTSDHRAAKERYLAYRHCQSVAWRTHTKHFNDYQHAKDSLAALEEG